MEFEDQVSISQKEVSASAMKQTVEAQPLNQLQSSGGPTSSSELSPTSVTQSVSSSQSQTLTLQTTTPQTEINNIGISRMDGQYSSDSKTLSTVRSPRTPSADGYNWRKYGQKQVKNPKGSRSYYRCTYSKCYAKKVECCDDSGSVFESIYRGQHDHDPPRKVNRASSAVPGPGSIAVSTITNPPVRVPINSDQSAEEPVLEITAVPEIKRQHSDSEDDAEIKVEESADERQPKKGAKKSSAGSPGSVPKPEKKPKFVVHAASDVGIAGDGYRWRKYGQKMVKGNPHPRNYYRCTSAGCPVRKHIENAVDNTSAVIITYKGVHDHDMPVPKKRHGPPSTPLVAAVVPASMMNTQQSKNPEESQNEISSTQWSVDKEGELTCKALDVGGEKAAIESARTLLSIGFEIKPC